MENRYLFRGKTINGNWVQGLLASKDDKWYISNKAGAPFAYEIRPESICQCTGLKDKNGKLIWENDIVKEFNSSGDEWNLSQIVFGEYSLNLGWCAKGIKTLHEYSRRLFNVGFGTSEAGKCEAIGNIFDNPELLKSEG